MPRKSKPVRVEILILTLIGVLSTSGGWVHAQAVQTLAPVSSFVDTTYKFSFAPPSLGADTSSPSAMIAALFGPAKYGFASNVNVTIQNTKTTRDAYESLTQEQFRSAHIKVTSDSALTVDGHDAILWEYSGSMNERDLRFLSLAIITPNKVYLLTCTCLPSEYDADAQAFRRSLLSFKFIRH